jgi:hypothetical protein
VLESYSCSLGSYVMRGVSYNVTCDDLVAPAADVQEDPTACDDA